MCPHSKFLLNPHLEPTQQNDTKKKIRFENLPKKVHLIVVELTLPTVNSELFRLSIPLKLIIYFVSIANKAQLSPWATRRLFHLGLREGKRPYKIASLLSV